MSDDITYCFRCMQYGRRYMRRRSPAKGDSVLKGSENFLRGGPSRKIKSLYFINLGRIEGKKQYRCMHHLVEAFSKAVDGSKWYGVNEKDEHWTVSLTKEGMQIEALAFQYDVFLQTVEEYHSILARISKEVQEFGLEKLRLGNRRLEHNRSYAELSTLRALREGKLFPERSGMYFDRFDVAEAYYLWLSEHHQGQGSDRYERLSKMGDYFDPSPNLTYGTLTENGKSIYDNLCKTDECKHEPETTMLDEDEQPPVGRFDEASKT